MKRIAVAVVVSLLMGFVGLHVTYAKDNMSVIFTIITMGAFIINEIQRSKNTDDEDDEDNEDNEDNE